MGKAGRCARKGMRPRGAICKSFRVTPSEAKRIEEVAAQNGVSESVLVRNGLRIIGVLERV